MLSCSAAVKEESGQNETGSVTNNMRLKKSYCHPECQIISQEQNQRSMTEKMNTFSSSLDPERIPVYQVKRDRQRQCPAQFATLVRRAVEKSHLRAWALQPDESVRRSLLTTFGYNLDHWVSVRERKECKITTGILFFLYCNHQAQWCCHQSTLRGHT